MEFATSTATNFAFFTFSFFTLHMIVYIGIFFLALYAIFWGITALYNALFQFVSYGDKL